MSQPKTDWQLIVGIVGGDIPSYEETYRRYYPRLHSFVRGMIKDASRAEDVVQNVFMKLWFNRGHLDPNLSLRNYLFVTARNEVLDFLRSKTHTAMSFGDSLPETAGSSRSDAKIEYLETSNVISGIVDKMPPRRRQVFIMSRYQHKSIDEISRELDLSPRTVEKHIELALQELRRTMN